MRDEISWFSPGRFRSTLEMGEICRAHPRFVFEISEISKRLPRFAFETSEISRTNLG